ncbi:MAG: DNRLRE domain-containing protein, partial [Clostridiales bacterium]|nr:DNRLRE domain-containing protein [Clostridiales bacterium]
MKKGFTLFLAVCLSLTLAQIPPSIGEVFALEAGVSASGTEYYVNRAETAYAFRDSGADTVVPLPLTGGPVTENFTFETEVLMERDSVTNLKLNLYSGAEQVRIIGISFALDYMTADNEKNNRFGKPAELPYDTGANGDEWSYVMLPGLAARDVYKRVKLYFDFSDRTYDLYFDDYLVSEGNYFTNEDAADLSRAELVAPKGVCAYKLRNTAITGGYSGLFVTPARVYGADGAPLARLTAGESAEVRFSALQSGGDSVVFTLRADHNGAVYEESNTLSADGTWREFRYGFTAETENDNITLGGYDASGGEFIKPSGFFGSPSVQDEAAVFIIGDSIVGPHSGATGWGAVIGRFLNENVAVEAFGRSGTSTRTYWHSGRPDVIGARIAEGDYLLLQLGHNDCAAAGTGSGVKNTTVAEYQAYLERYIRFAREHGAHLVFITPPTQMRVGSADQFSLADTATPLYERVAAMKSTAAAYGVPAIDLYADSRDAFRRVLNTDGNLSRIYVDGTHFTEAGAEYLSYYITRGLTALDNGAAGLVARREAADKTILQALLDVNAQKSQNDYTFDSFAAFHTERNNSLYLLEHPFATQSGIDAQTEALKTAIDGLVAEDPGGKTVILASKDAFVQRGAAGTTFNTDIVLAKYPTTERDQSVARRGFVGFNIENVPDTAAQVVLKLYVTQLGSNATYADTISVHSTTDNWAETTLTWNNMPTSYSAAPLATFGPLNIFADNANYADVMGFKSFDVTDYVLSEKAKGTKNLSFAVAANASGSAYCSFSSKENTNGNGPRLETRAAAQKSIGEMKREDLDALRLEDYLGGAAANQVTDSLDALPAIGAVNGSGITWRSDRTDILSNAGEIVARPSENTPVTLTAVIDSDGFERTREFPLVVFMDTVGWTDEDYIRYELDRLEFSDFSTQNPQQVYTPITLPSVSAYAFCTYRWAASDGSVASIADYIARFTVKNDVAAQADLIVTAERGTASLTKTFPVTLLRGFAENLAAGAKITASSGKTIGVTTRDFDTYWEAAAKDGANTLTFTFDGAADVNSALFVERGDTVRGFTVAYSDDGKTWVTAYAGTTLGDRARELIEFKPFRAKFVRFTVTAKDAGQASLYTAE